MFSSYNPPVISSIYIEGLEISAKDAEAAAIAARDAAQAARDDALQYRNEAYDYYTQVQQVQTGDYVTTQTLNQTLAAFSFADLASVPSTYAPSAHTHAWGDITGKPAAYTPAYHTHLWAHITDKPTEFEPAEHVHTWQQIAEKPSTFPPEAHYHNWSEIEGKPNVFNPAAHTHSWGDITGKPTKFEPVAHTHTWDSIENKPLTFAPDSHTHHWDTVTNKPAQATRWPTFTEVTGKPAQATRWPSYDEVTGKPVFGSSAYKDVGTNVGQVPLVGAFGLGLSAIITDDFDSINVTGFYRNNSGSAVGMPFGGTLFNVQHIKTSDNAATQLAIDAFNQTTAERIFIRSKGAGDTWQPWRELLHTGNSVNALDVGLGTNGAYCDGNNANNAIEGGIYNATSSTINTAITGTSTIIVSRSFNVVSQINVDGNNMFIRRSTDTGATYQPWREIVHSGDYNGDTFGGESAGEKLASGFAKFSNFAVFEVKLNNVISARNIEVNGTFEIVDKVNGNTIVNGINGLSLSGDSSNKEGIIVFNSGGSIFTKGQLLELYTSVNGAYFKVT